jgi:hypothetical protein
LSHQSGDESHIARKPVELRDQHAALGTTGHSQRSGELGPPVARVGPFVGFCHNVFGDALRPSASAMGKTVALAFRGILLAQQGWAAQIVDAPMRHRSPSAFSNTAPLRQSAPLLNGDNYFEQRKCTGCRSSQCYIHSLYLVDRI